MINISNGRMDTRDGTFAAHVEIDCNDGDPTSRRLFDLMVEIMTIATKGALVIELHPATAEGTGSGAAITDQEQT